MTRTRDDDINDVLLVMLQVRQERYGRDEADVITEGLVRKSRGTRKSTPDWAPAVSEDELRGALHMIYSWPFAIRQDFHQRLREATGRTLFEIAPSLSRTVEKIVTKKKPPRRNELELLQEYIVIHPSGGCVSQAKQKLDRSLNQPPT